MGVGRTRWWRGGRDLLVDVDIPSLTSRGFSSTVVYYTLFVNLDSAGTLIPLIGAS